MACRLQVSPPLICLDFLVSLDLSFLDFTKQMRYIGPVKLVLLEFIIKKTLNKFMNAIKNLTGSMCPIRLLCNCKLKQICLLRLH